MRRGAEGSTLKSSGTSAKMDMQGIASIALLPSGSISGHFVDSCTSKCFGLFGTQIACERECSRGEDYRLIKLSIFDYTNKREKQIIVESRGQDAARFQNATDAHGWEEDVVQALRNKERNVSVPTVKFDCEVLKADEDAEMHIKQYLPALVGREAVVNIGKMEIKGLKFETPNELEEVDCKKSGPSDECAKESLNDVREEIDDMGDDISMDCSTSMSEVGQCVNFVSSNKELEVILQQELQAEGILEDGSLEAASALRNKDLVQGLDADCPI